MSESIIAKAKASAGSLKEKVTTLKDNFLDDEKREIIEEFKDSGQEKIRESLATLSEFAALFKEAGYQLTSINATVSVPPAINISFKVYDSIPVEERTNVLAKAQNNRIALIILNSLFKASDFSNSIKIGDYKLGSINMKLGLIPSISVSFT